MMLQLGIPGGTVTGFRRTGTSDAPTAVFRTAPGSTPTRDPLLGYFDGSAIALDLPGHGDSSWRRPRLLAGCQRERDRRRPRRARRGCRDRRARGAGRPPVRARRALARRAHRHRTATPAPRPRGRARARRGPPVRAGGFRERPRAGATSWTARATSSRDAIVDRAISFGFGPSRRRSCGRSRRTRACATTDASSGSTTGRASIRRLPAATTATSGTTAAVSVPVTLVAGEYDFVPGLLGEFS